MKFKAYKREKPEHTMAYVKISGTRTQKFAFLFAL